MTMVEEETESSSALDRFVRDVARAIAVDVTKRAVYAIAAGFVALVALLMWKGGTVPTWTLVLAFLAALVVGLALRGRPIRRLRDSVEDVAYERSVLDDENTRYAAALERHETYSGHVAQALDALQRIVAGDIDIPIPHYVEAGVLEPARALIADNSPGNVRLSVLLPRPQLDRWFMPWAAGHSLTGKAKYDQRIVDTLSRHAYESGESQHWSDVRTDRSFRQNPRASHDTRTLLSLPIRSGDRILGVFNVVSSEPEAFDPTEETYLESLGAVISVAVGLHLKDQLDGIGSA
jgi:hypothetical protein